MDGQTLALWRSRLRAQGCGVQDASGRFAVLALLCRWQGQLALLFEQRADGLRGQPGEACFPGGRMEDGESPYDAALRETFEEIGLAQTCIHHIADLDVIVDISNRVIYPFLAYTDDDVVTRLRPNPQEVKDIFFVPLDALREQEPNCYPAHVRVEVGQGFPYDKIGMEDSYHWRGGIMDVPIYEYQGKTVWGMTARAVRALLKRLDEAGL